MLVVSQFARAVMPHGTTTMFTDPHEVANVLGLPGVRLMHDEAMVQPINVFVEMPSCAPSAPGLETPGAEIGPADVAEAMGWPGIVGLGEMMNYPGVIAGDAKMLAEIAATQRAGKTVGGHYASPDLTDFPAYAAGGPADDHEGTREADAIARVRQGMRAMLRLGLGLVRREGADHRGHREGARPAQLHPLHRRLPFGHAGERGPHGPGGAARHRLRARPAGGAADGDDQHRDAFRDGARARVDRAGAAGGLHPDLGPADAAHRDGDRARRDRGRGRALPGAAAGLRLAGRRRGRR